MRLKLMTAAVLCAATGLAQAPDVLVNESKFQWSVVRDNLLKMADKMPAEDYDFKPAMGMETFAQRVAHIAGANLNICQGVAGNVRPFSRTAITAKADLLALLKQANAACDATFASLNDTTALEKINSRLGGPFPPEPARTKLATLYNLVRHSNEMYGYMCVYLRLKGIVPPSSAPE